MREGEKREGEGGGRKRVGTVRMLREAGAALRHARRDDPGAALASSGMHGAAWLPKHWRHENSSLGLASLNQPRLSRWSGLQLARHSINMLQYVE